MVLLKKFNFLPPSWMYHLFLDTVLITVLSFTLYELSQGFLTLPVQVKVYSFVTLLLSIICLLIAEKREKINEDGAKRIAFWLCMLASSFFWGGIICKNSHFTPYSFFSILIMTLCSLFLVLSISLYKKDNFEYYIEKRNKNLKWIIFKKI